MSNQPDEVPCAEALEIVLQRRNPPLAVREGVGLCLSGGGYRAMTFHLGSTIRLNESGWLHQLRRVSSVSGGSILAGVLGLQWTSLDFHDQNGRMVATNFDELVARPIREMGQRTIDVPSVVTGLGWPGLISRRLSSSYRRHLFGDADLQSLPSEADGPRFVFSATDLGQGALVRFSRPYIRDGRDLEVFDPEVGIAEVVAASSAFPPVLSPMILKMPGHSELRLTDGGVYDNLGVETVLKNYRTVFVSDGGGLFKIKARPPRGFARGAVRLPSVIDVQVRRLRRRELMAALTSGARSGGFWSVNSPVADLEAPAATLPVSPARAEQLARVKTRLKRLDEPTLHSLINWGYAVTDAVLRAYVDPGLPEPAGFPHPGAPMG